MPWDGGPKWTVIAHTIGRHGNLSEQDRDELQALGFALPPPGELKSVKVLEAQEEEIDQGALFEGPSWFPPPDDPEEEMWTRMWTRRLLDEEGVLAPVVPDELRSEFEAVEAVNKELSDSLAIRRILPTGIAMMRISGWSYADWRKEKMKFMALNNYWRPYRAPSRLSTQLSWKR